MAEWLNAAVLKTVLLKGNGGSNPSFSAVGLMVEWLQFHPVTVRGTGSNPVETANFIIMNKRELLVLVFCVFAILLRLVPHPPNFAPITSLAIFGGVMFRNKWLGMSLPLLVMFISDLFLGFSMITPWVYGSFLLISFISKEVNNKNILMGSILFFIITNFGVWVLGYPKTWEGLVLCYTLAIPFFVNSILGDFFFSYLLKYSFEYSRKYLFSFKN